MEKLWKPHESLTEERVLEAAKRQMFDLDDPGFCWNCGAEVDGCEPDMQRGPCPECGRLAVFGAQETMLHLIA